MREHIRKKDDNLSEEVAELLTQSCESLIGHSWLVIDHHHADGLPPPEITGPLYLLMYI